MSSVVLLPCRVVAVRRNPQLPPFTLAGNSLLAAGCSTSGSTDNHTRHDRRATHDKVDDPQPAVHQLSSVSVPYI